MKPFPFGFTSRRNRRHNPCPVISAATFGDCLLRMWAVFVPAFLVMASATVATILYADDPVAGVASPDAAAQNLDRRSAEVGPVDTDPLVAESDLASDMVDGIDRFLLRKIADTAAARGDSWKLDVAVDGALENALQPRRESLAKILGVVDARIAPKASTMMHDVDHSVSPRIASSERFDVFAIAWPVLGEPSPPNRSLASLYGEGLALVPRDARSLDAPTVIVIPDADQTPEQLSGLVDGIAPQSQVARRLAESGYRVLLPSIVSRHREKREGRANLTDREYLHRPAFELGRTLAGYEVQMVLSLVDSVQQQSPTNGVALFGYGEGGMLALFAAAIDTRITAVGVSGFFGPREGSWQEPIERNFFGLLNDFGAAELATLVAGRTLVVETARGPELVLSGDGGAPAELRSPDPDAADALLETARRRLPPPAGDAFVSVRPADGTLGSDDALSPLIKTPDAGATTAIVAGDALSPITLYGDKILEMIESRRTRIVHQIDRHTQAVLRESPFVRAKYMADLKTESLAQYESSSEAYREKFRHEVIGHFDESMLPPGAKSRKAYETDLWTGYEITLDVFPDVFAYGVLLLPKDLKPGERRPVVVCQHGLEGRPVDTFQDDHYAYHDFAAKLCENGLIVFSPQNPYLFTDRFRTLQRKAQPIGKTLFSVIVPQHQQIVNWLKSQPFTDPEKIAFYGLSYGGKTAMRVPALVTDYCLSICSADFNEWVLKNASSRDGFSYLWTGEYEIFEWDLGSTFNYAEMAALICPRPFMVERGHFDGVGEDHWVAFEYAKVRNLYAAKLGIGDRTEIEWFVGPHTINGRGTFDFLSRHLDWPIHAMGQPAGQPADKP
jgi:dienelactone hydrolase